MCSTKNSNSMVDIVKHGKVKQNPITVLKYNKGKGSIDLADQKTSYANPLRRSLKWYHKFFIDILLNISVVNASYLYNTVKQSKTSITHFRLALIPSLVKNFFIMDRPFIEKHELIVVNRSRCYICYQNMSATKRRIYAQSHSTKVKTKCLLCKKYLCLKCFHKTHINSLK